MQVGLNLLNGPSQQPVPTPALQWPQHDCLQSQVRCCSPSMQLMAPALQNGRPPQLHADVMLLDQHIPLGLIWSCDADTGAE